MSDNKLSKYGVKLTADGYSVDGKSLLASVGGVQGIVETSLPGFIYVLTYAITRNLVYAITGASLAVAVLTIRHLVKKRPIVQLLGSFVGIGLAIWLFWSVMVARWSDAYYYRMARREIADDEHDLMPEVLELAELAQHHREAEVDVGGRRVDPELHPQRRTTAELAAQVGLGDGVDRAGGEDPDLLVDADHGGERYQLPIRPGDAGACGHSVTMVRCEPG